MERVPGNHLTMRFLMGALAENAVEVPLISRPYQLAVLPGRENVVAPLGTAMTPHQAELLARGNVVIARDTSLWSKSSTDGASRA